MELTPHQMIVQKRTAYISAVGKNLKEILQPLGYTVESFQYLVGITIKFPESHKPVTNYKKWLYNLLEALPDVAFEPVKVTFNIEDGNNGAWVVINPPDDYHDELMWQIQTKNITGEFSAKKKVEFEKSKLPTKQIETLKKKRKRL